MSVLLSPWPTGWSQNADPAKDGDPGSGNNSTLNCGPESVAECVMYITGVSLDADYVKDVMHGAAYVGDTTADDLRSFLNGYAGIPTGLPLVAAPSVVASHIKSWLDGGYAAISLFWWDALGDGAQHVGHWCPVYAYNDDGSLVISDPWPGTSKVLAPAQWQTASQGLALRLGRKRSIVY